MKSILGRVLRGVFAFRPRPKASLPFGRTTALTNLGPSEGLMKFEIEIETSRRLADLARREGCTHFSVRLAAFAALLAETSGQSKINFGTFFSTRNRAVGRELFGFCANFATVILPYDGAQTFRQFVAVVRNRMRAVQSHGELPYEVLRSELHAWKTRLPQANNLLVSMATPHPGMFFADLHLSHVRESTWGAMPPGFDLKFECNEGLDECTLGFNAHIYAPELVHNFMVRWKHLLEIVSRDPGIPIRAAIRLIAQLEAKDAQKMRPETASLSDVRYRDH
jgi:hypothetical protein